MGCEKEGVSVMVEGGFVRSWHAMRPCITPPRAPPLGLMPTIGAGNRSTVAPPPWWVQAAGTGHSARPVTPTRARTIMRRTMPCNVSACSLNTADKKEKYRAKQMRYADGGRKNAKREEVEMRMKTKK